MSDERARAWEEDRLEELKWYLDEVQEMLQTLKSGLEEIAVLLAPNQDGSTLALSSFRSECLKGFVTRVGTRISKGDVKLRVSGLQPPKGAAAYPLSISTAPQAPTLVIEQLTAARTLVNACLDVVDASKWAGDVKDASFIAGQYRLLDVNLQEAKMALKGAPNTIPEWWRHPVDAEIFDPPLPDHVSFHMYVSDAGIVLEIRMLEPILPEGTEHHGGMLGLRDRLAGALGVTSRPTSAVHEEVDEVFSYKGQDVKVRERVRVEAQDPKLLAALAKLNHVERSVALTRSCLSTLMEKEV